MAGKSNPDRPGAAGRVGLAVLAFGSGAALMALEIVGSRILAPWFGSSVVIWGSLIGVFLGAAAVGAALGGLLADVRPRPSTLSGLLSLAAILTAATPFTAFPLLSLLVSALPDLRASAMAAAVCLFAGPCAALGALSPVILRFSRPSAEKVGRTAGWLAAVSTAGGIAGALGAAFFGIPLWSTTRLIAVIAGSLAVLSLGAAWAQRSRTAMAWAGFGLAAVLLLLTGSPTENNHFRSGPGWSPRLAQASGGSSLPGQPRWSTMSRYQKIDVWEIPTSEPGYDSLRFLLLDGVPNGIAGIVGDDPLVTRPPAVSTFSHAVWLLPDLRPGLESILFVGLGAGVGPMAVKTRRPELSVEVVEIDPAVADSACDWFGFDPRRVPTHIGDGRVWLASQTRRWDAIVLDAYRGDALPFHLLTLEYARIVRNHLNDGGVVVMNLPGTLQGPGSDLLHAVLTTWTRIFPQTAMIPLPALKPDGSPIPDGPRPDDACQIRNIVLVLSEHALPSAGALAAGLRENGPEPPSVLSKFLATSIVHAPLNPSTTLLTDDYAPVDLWVGLPQACP